MNASKKDSAHLMYKLTSAGLKLAELGRSPLCVPSTASSTPSPQIPLQDSAPSSTTPTNQGIFYNLQQGRVTKRDPEKSRVRYPRGDSPLPRAPPRLLRCQSDLTHDRKVSLDSIPLRVPRPRRSTPQETVDSVEQESYTPIISTCTVKESSLEPPPSFTVSSRASSSSTSQLLLRKEPKGAATRSEFLRQWLEANKNVAVGSHPNVRSISPSSVHLTPGLESGMEFSQMEEEEEEGGLLWPPRLVVDGDDGQTQSQQLQDLKQMSKMGEALFAESSIRSRIVDSHSGSVAREPFSRQGEAPLLCIPGRALHSYTQDDPEASRSHRPTTQRNREHLLAFTSAEAGQEGRTPQSPSVGSLAMYQCHPQHATEPTHHEHHHHQPSHQTERDQHHTVRHHGEQHFHHHHYHHFVASAPSLHVDGQEGAPPSFHEQRHFRSDVSAAVAEVATASVDFKRKDKGKAA